MNVPLNTSAFSGHALAHDRASRIPLLSRPLPSAPAAQTQTTLRPPVRSVIGSSVLAEGTKSPHRRIRNEKRKNQGNHQQDIGELIALNEGRTEALMRYLAGDWPIPSLSLRNVMLMASEKPTATYAAGFHAWQRLGRDAKAVR